MSESNDFMDLKAAEADDRLGFIKKVYAILFV